jgi:GNAT superfamily N-acetyltransferase
MGHMLTIAGVIRKIEHHEADIFSNHLLRLDAQSRHDRFHGGISDDALRAYGQKALNNGGSIFGFFIENELRGAVELLITNPLGGDADLAFTVEQDYQNAGIGGALMGRAILVARHCGIEHLHLTFVPYNTAMQQLAARYGATFKVHSDDIEADFSPFY